MYTVIRHTRACCQLAHGEYTWSTSLRGSSELTKGESGQKVQRTRCPSLKRAELSGRIAADFCSDSQRKRYQREGGVRKHSEQTDELAGSRSSPAQTSSLALGSSQVTWQSWQQACETRARQGWKLRPTLRVTLRPSLLPEL